MEFCHGSMSYRQDFRRNVAPFTAAPAQEHASSETIARLVKRKSRRAQCAPWEASSRW